MTTVGSLFAGIGGFDEGFRRAGMRTTWAVELNADGRRVLAARFPDAELREDVTECGKRNLPAVDVICGGFPCQDLSVAGKRGGLSGSRSGLFWEMVRITDELRPRLLVWENVPGLLSSDDGRDFARVLRGLADIGYFGAWRVLDAQFFGVPQRRRRVFGVFARGRAAAGSAAEILALTEGGGRDPAARREAGAGVAGTLGSSPEGAGWRDDFDRAGAFVTPFDMRQASWGATMTNNRGEGKAAGGAPGTGIGEPGDPAPTLADTHTPAVACALKPPSKGAAWKGDAADNLVFQANGAASFRGGAPSLAASDDNGSNQVVAFQCHGSNVGPMGTVRSGNGGLTGGVPFTAFAQNQRDEVRDLGGVAGALAAEPGMKQQTYIAHALTSQGHDASEDGTGRGTPLVPIAVGLGSYPLTSEGITQPMTGRNGDPGVVAFKESQSGCREGAVHATLDANKGSRRQEGVHAGMMVRRLTPVECCRLQGFPDTWLDLDPPLSDSAKYRLLGNAVAVPCAEYIGRRIAAALSREETP